MATKFITVSIEIMHDKNLTPNQKFILAEIEQLTQLDRGCFASNKHFSELIGISIAGVSNAIQDLEKKRYITIDNSDTKRNFGRKITIHSGVESSIHSGVESKENKTSSLSNQLDYDNFFNLWNEFATKNNIKIYPISPTLYDTLEDFDAYEALCLIASEKPMSYFDFHLKNPPLPQSSVV